MTEIQIQAQATLVKISNDERWQFIIEWEGKGAVLAYIYLCLSQDIEPNPVHFKNIYLGISQDWCYYIPVDGIKHRFKRD